MLKLHDPLLEQDARFRNRIGGINADDSIRLMTIGDLYDEVQPLELRPETPRVIRKQFDKARHTFIYSCFAYDLASLAEQQGYQVLEMALPQKLPSDELAKARESAGVSIPFLSGR